jgi:hypothetical protein
LGGSNNPSRKNLYMAAYKLTITQKTSTSAMVKVGAKNLHEVTFPEDVTDKGLARRARKAAQRAGLVEAGRCLPVTVNRL